jgi:hypothetical protein
MTSDQYSSRSTRVEHHYHTHYGDRYDYYRSQPYVYVGGGYSSLFWYSMMDWSLERRALWMYHNQNSMDRALYQQQLAENAQLQAEIARLQTAGTPVNTNYVDSEYADSPDLMYSDEYVDAAYNPAPVAVAQPRPVRSTSSGSGVLTFFLVLLVIGGLGFAFWFVFIRQHR